MRCTNDGCPCRSMPLTWTVMLNGADASPRGQYSWVYEMPAGVSVASWNGGPPGWGGSPVAGCRVLNTVRSSVPSVTSAWNTGAAGSKLNVSPTHPDGTALDGTNAACTRTRTAVFPGLSSCAAPATVAAPTGA